MAKKKATISLQCLIKIKMNTCLQYVHYCDFLCFGLVLAVNHFKRNEAHEPSLWMLIVNFMF